MNMCTKCINVNDLLPLLWCIRRLQCSGADRTALWCWSELSGVGLTEWSWSSWEPECQSITPTTRVRVSFRPGLQESIKPVPLKLFIMRNPLCRVNRFVTSQKKENQNNIYTIILLLIVIIKLVGNQKWHKTISKMCQKIIFYNPIIIIIITHLIGR